MEQAARDARGKLGCEAKTCGICLEPFRLGSENANFGLRTALVGWPVTLECGDMFCYQCLSLWLKNHTHCPALGCGVELGDTAAVQASIDAQVHRYDRELGEVLDLI